MGSEMCIRDRTHMIQLGGETYALTDPAMLLLIGGVIGAQFGTTLGTKLKAEQLRILLALLVLVVCGKLALELLLQPAELYSVGFTS